MVAELFPKFGAPDYSTEISRLSALAPDVILSTAWGGDLDTFVRQSSQRGLLDQSTFVLPLAESSLQRLGKDLKPGHIVGGRGDHYFLHPEKVGDRHYDAFVEAFHEKTGAYPNLSGLPHQPGARSTRRRLRQGDRRCNGGEWPDDEQVVDAMAGLSFSGLGREVTLREDGQGLEDQLLGTSVHTDDYDFAILDDIMIFDADDITTPVGMISTEWISTLTSDWADSLEVDTFTHTPGG